MPALTGVAMEVPAFDSKEQLFPSAFSEAAATDSSDCPGARMSGCTHRQTQWLQQQQVRSGQVTLMRPSAAGPCALKDAI